LRVTKLGGWAAEVVCPEREAETGICRLKRDADEAGQLELLLVAVGDALAEPGISSARSAEPDAVREDPMIRIRRILVCPPTSSPPALTALAHAKTLAAEFGSRLCCCTSSRRQTCRGAPKAPSPWPTLLADIEKGVRAQFQHLIPPDDPLANEVTMETMIGVPVDGILDYTETHHIDLVVMGTHGRGMVGHLLLGSVASRSFGDRPCRS
jgi:nucleotide-binding universal stress UspA family protein